MNTIPEFIHRLKSSINLLQRSKRECTAWCSFNLSANGQFYSFIHSQIIIIITRYSKVKHFYLKVIAPFLSLELPRIFMNELKTKNLISVT